jgi:hypothetical protein
MANGIYKDPAARKAYLKAYYQAHKATMDARSKDYYQRHKEAIKRANNERYRAKCMELFNSEKE